MGGGVLGLILVFRLEDGRTNAKEHGQMTWKPRSYGAYTDVKLNDHNLKP